MVGMEVIMALRAVYYFKHPDKLPLTGLMDDDCTACDVLVRAKPLLNEVLTAYEVRENNGTLKGGNVHFYGNYYIGKGTVIYNDVTIIGPVYIGKGCELMPGAIIRPYTIIGDKCSVGHGSEVKHSVLFGGAKVASLAFVGDSVLGASARIGSGVITANRRFDQGDIKLKTSGGVYEVGDSYFGLVLGDSARLGANCVTQPGTHIGPHTWVYPMTTVRGFIPSEKRVYHPQSIEMEDNEIIELKE
jgi:bifunctional UDP-N-acetylglucosamine pyrophosphorylase/glucosamine-1-phosphate N-acetyltransferase